MDGEGNSVIYFIREKTKRTQKVLSLTYSGMKSRRSWIISKTPIPIHHICLIWPRPRSLLRLTWAIRPCPNTLLPGIILPSNIWGRSFKGMVLKSRPVWRWFEFRLSILPSESLELSPKTKIWPSRLWVTPRRWCIIRSLKKPNSTPPKSSPKSFWRPLRPHDPHYGLYNSTSKLWVMCK